MGQNNVKERNEVLTHFVKCIVHDVEDVYKKHGGEITECNKYEIERDVRKIERYYSHMAYMGYGITVK